MVKVALVHDYLREYGGAERVLEALHDLYPDAPVYTAFVDKKALGIHWQRFEEWDLRETWITKIPGYKKLFSPLRVFSPSYFSRLDLSEYDVVISSSNAYFAKAVKVPNGVHICYCHTPARSLYGYATMSDWKKNPMIRIVGTLINHYLRVVDFQVAQNVDHFIANSEETARRIRKFYRREATVIYPPVAVHAEVVDKQAAKDGYFIYVNRLAFAKHPEIAVRVCSKLGVSLKVIGEGKMRSDLEAMASEKVEFLGGVTDQRLHHLYQGARALLYPVEDEDFGIVPVEAMGHGVPVIAHRSGGPRETVIEGETGIFFSDLSAAGLEAAIQDFEKSTFNRKKIQAHAQQFRVDAFGKNITNLVARLSKN